VPSMAAAGVVRVMSPPLELTTLVEPTLIFELAPLVAIVTPVLPVTLALIAIVPLPVLVNATEPDEAVRAPEAVSPVPEVIVIVVDVPVTVPVVTVPNALTVNVLLPRVSVCPDAV